jgi:hypothetical protein
MGLFIMKGKLMKLALLLLLVFGGLVAIRYASQPESNKFGEPINWELAPPRLI